MLQVFQEYLDNFYLSISGIWCLCQKEVRNGLLKQTGSCIINSSLPDKEDIYINMYELSLKLPEPPFKGVTKIDKYIEKQARLTLIASYEWAKDALEAKNVDMRNWPDILKLFKHLRDAAAHKNYFNLKDTRFLPLSWGCKTLSVKDNGKKLFSKWMTPGDLEHFLEDVSKELQKII